MELSLLPDTSNGGFPEPPATGPIRVVEARHAACGEATRVRLPVELPAGAIRHLHCAGCGEDFETSLIHALGVQEQGAEEIVVRAQNQEEPEAGANSLALPEFKLPMFGELELPSVKPAEPVISLPEPVIEAEPVVVMPEPEPVVEAEPVVVMPEPEPVAVEPEPVVAAQPEPVVAVKPEPVAPAEPEPVAPAGPAPKFISKREGKSASDSLREAIAAELSQVFEEPQISDAQTVEDPAPVPLVPQHLRAQPVEYSAPAPEPLTHRRELKLPEIKLPDVKLPQVKVPQLSAIKLPELPRLSKVDPNSPGFRLASAAAAVVAVIVLLGAIQGDDESSIAPQLAAATEQATSSSDLPSADELRAANADSDEVIGDSAIPADNEGGKGNGSKQTELVRGSTYSLALPQGWEQIDNAEGAAFAAQSADGTADAQLWISEDPKLDFPGFINLSMQQVESLAGEAEIVERIPGPTPETTIVRIAADAPEGEPSYEVTLRAAGPYFYYLATSVQPAASPEAVEGAELIVGSFTPEASQ